LIGLRAPSLGSSSHGGMRVVKTPARSAPRRVLVSSVVHVRAVSQPLTLDVHQQNERQ
jgi:hypothetical protein